MHTIYIEKKNYIVKSNQSMEKIKQIELYDLEHTPKNYFFGLISVSLKSLQNIL